MWVTDCSTLSVTAVQSAGEGGGGDENRTASLVQLSETRRQACWKSGNGGRRVFLSDSNKVSTGRERWHVIWSSTHIHSGTWCTQDLLLQLLQSLY